MPEFNQDEIRSIVEFVKDAKKNLNTLSAIEQLATSNQRQIAENQKQIAKNQQAIEQIYAAIAGKLMNGKKGMYGRLEDLEEAEKNRHELEKQRQEELMLHRRESIKLRYTITGGVVIWLITFLIQVFAK